MRWSQGLPAGVPTQDLPCLESEFSPGDDVLRRSHLITVIGFRLKSDTSNTTDTVLIPPGGGTVCETETGRRNIGYRGYFRRSQ